MLKRWELFILSSKEGKRLAVLNGQYHGCWWLGDAGRQSYSIYGIIVNKPGYVHPWLYKTCMHVPHQWMKNWCWATTNYRATKIVNFKSMFCQSNAWQTPTCFIWLAKCTFGQKNCTNKYNSIFQRLNVFIKQKISQCGSIYMKIFIFRHFTICTTKLILGLRPANERRRYKVKPSLIGWVQT